MYWEAHSSAYDSISYRCGDHKTESHWVIPVRHPGDIIDWGQLGDPFEPVPGNILQLTSLIVRHGGRIERSIVTGSTTRVFDGAPLTAAG